MPRLFTLHEANALLPRLREILAEMQQARAALDKLEEPLRKARRSATGNGHVVGDPALKEAERLTGLLTERMEEISQLGCELKGLEQGLIDFPTEREGTVVYLCWKLGEDEIGFWHDVDAGFAGRRPLD